MKIEMLEALFAILNGCGIGNHSHTIARVNSAKEILIKLIEAEKKEINNG